MIKNLHIFGMLFLLGVIFSSCIRDYSCECTYRYTGAGHPPNTSEILEMRNTKKEAKAICTERSQVLVNAQGDSTIIDCNLY